jgi:hypothetical protein
MNMAGILDRRSGRLAALLLLSFSVSSAEDMTNAMPAQAPADAPDAFPAEVYLQAMERGEAVYTVDSAASTAFVRVSRAGFLARFGHDHVVASHDVAGYAWLPDPAGTLSGARADIYLPLATLSVDDATSRQAVGLEPNPSARDIEGTRTNMFRSLDAVAYPWLVVSVLMTSDNALFANLTLQGILHGYRIPVNIEFDDDALNVSGEFQLRQTDHGIEPFRALGGALSVADELAVRFDLVAKKK